MTTAKQTLCILLMLAIQSAVAAELDPIDPAAIDVLKRAYHANGDSMERWGSLDAEDLPIRVTPTIMHPVDKWSDKNALDRAADVPKIADRNICTIHKMRKIYTEDGSSWRCRK